MDAAPGNVSNHDEGSPAPPAQSGHERIIGSGLSRTGTRSVYALLIRNGRPAVHYPFDMSTQEALATQRIRSLWPDVSVLDLPAALVFEELAAVDPGALVLHTTRDHDEWVPAVLDHYESLLGDWHTFPERFTDFSEWISRETYGAFPPTFGGVATAGERQEERVAQWHKQHPSRLIRVNVFTGAGCDLLSTRLAAEDMHPRAMPHVQDADEVPLTLGLAERTLLREEIPDTNRDLQ